MDYPALDPFFNPAKLQEAQFWHNVNDPVHCFVHSLDDLMSHAIDAALMSSSANSGFPGNRRGGPFGAAGAIPWIISTRSGELPFGEFFRSLKSPEQISLKIEDVRSWRVIIRAANMVEVLHDYTAHAEGMFARYVGPACGGRNLWKRFVVLATSGEPCAMCAAALGYWGFPRAVLSGASIRDAITFGFHEGLSSNAIQALQNAQLLTESESKDWAGDFRKRGICVRTGIKAAEVVDRLYRPYFSSGGHLYNSGPDDSSG